MNKAKWAAVAVFGVVVLIAFMVGVSLLAGWGYGSWGYGGWGMMGPRMMGGTFFMWLIPVGFIILTMLGIVWFVRTIGSENHPAAPTHTCSSCGRDVQNDWKNCPYCGTSIK